MAALEKDGLLTHPHTSAGRIPTDAGYRYFVQNLMADTELPSSERQLIRSEFSQARRELDQWLRVSTSVLARASHGAALATAPKAHQSRFKHLELVGIHDSDGAAGAGAWKRARSSSRCWIWTNRWSSMN